MNYLPIRMATGLGLDGDIILLRTFDCTCYLLRSVGADDGGRSDWNVEVKGLDPGQLI